MPTKFQNVRQNFSKGVLTPRLSTRVDLQDYTNALRSCKNFIISSQGGAVMREGGEFLGYPKTNTRFRLMQFLRGGEQSDLVLEVTPGTIRIWDEGALYVDPTTQAIAELSNPYTDADLDDLYFVNQDKFGVICSGRHPPLYITFYKDGAVASELLKVERIFDYDYNDLNSPKRELQEADWTINFPTSWQVSSFVYTAMYGYVSSQLTFNYDPNDALVNATNIKLMLDTSAARQGFALVFTVTPVAGVDGAYTVTVTGGSAYLPVRIFPADDSWGYTGTGFLPMQMPPLSQPYYTDAPALPFNAAATGVAAILEPVWSYPYYVLHNGTYYKCIKVHTVGADNEPGVGVDWQLYWQDVGATKPEGFDYQFPSGNNWADLSAGDIIAPWDRGFPTVACFHEQRLILMANKDNPTAIYGSGIANYQNFVIGPNDDDAWLFILDANDSPQIKWAVSDKALLLGTSSGEWLITAEVTITPSDINAERQNASRSKLGRPVHIDREIFYIEQGGRKLRATSYVRERQGFTSSNASVLFEHLVSEPRIRRLAIQHSPEMLMTMITEEGQAVYMTYEPTTGVIAATELETEGTVYDVSAYFDLNFNQDSTYIAVQRNGIWMLERIRYPSDQTDKGITAKGIVLMDSWVSGTLSSNIITGLQHLEGLEVHVIVDDTWEVGDYTVNSGQVVIGHDTGTYAVGLPYIAQLETMEMDDNVQGTGLGTKRRWNKLWTRILNSALPKVYGQRDRDRTPAVPTGTPDTIRAGLQDIPQNVSGYTDGSLTVIQDRPFPTHIVGFFGEYQVEDR